jgi:hypothetical protein
MKTEWFILRRAVRWAGMLAALLVIATCCVCVDLSDKPKQAAGRDAQQDNSAAVLRIEQPSTPVLSPTTSGPADDISGLKIETPIASPETRQINRGVSLISVQSSGGSALPWLILVASAILNFVLWDGGRYWKKRLAELVSHVEGSETKDVKLKMCATIAKQTPFGRLVNKETKAKG